MKNSTNGFLKESNAAAESENQYQRGHLHWNSNHRCDSPLYVFVWFNQYLCACAEKINLATWVVRAECLAELSQLNCLWFHCSVDRNKPWPDTRRSSAFIHHLFHRLWPKWKHTHDVARRSSSSEVFESFEELGGLSGLIISVCFSMYVCRLQLPSCTYCLCTLYSTSLPPSLGDVLFCVF